MIHAISMRSRAAGVARRAPRASAAALLLLVILAAPVAAQTSEPASRKDAIELRASALEALSATSGDAALERFIERHVGKHLRASMSDEALMERLREVRHAGAEAGMVNISVTPDGFAIDYEGATASRVTVELEPGPPFTIAAIGIEEVERAPAETVEPITWETLESRLDEAEQDGFSGVVMVVRGGRTVLDRAYGMADRDSKRRNTTETIFDIGSTPIDFTKAAILLLAQRGKLSLRDSIGTYIDGVPADKRGITIEHLMTGRSGLPNFHHLPGDADRDLAWIDRDEAVRRIMARELLFAPGEGEAHSHSAWGLLAVIVEIASGESYADFLKTNFFEPAGMTRTGFYGPDRRFGERDYAVGYGTSAVGTPNTPFRWGKTSWLVMGAGGMVSTVGDMDRWVRFVLGGKVLGEEALERYRIQGILAGGSDRGFLFTYSQGFESAFYLACNDHEREDDAAWRLTRALADLVRGR